MERLADGTVLWIQSVYVVPEFRRKGTYKAFTGTSGQWLK
jgi:predicted GNAT family acetyltransferase